MDLSVVIVSYDSEAHIGACLDSLDRHLTGVTHEICVVDNASTDGTREVVARRPHVTLVANARNRGFAAAVNEGLAATTGRLVMWINPDSALMDGGTSRLMADLDAAADVGIVGPCILDPDGALQRSARAFPSYDWAVGHRHSWLTRLFPNNPYSRRYLLGDLDPDRVSDVDWVSGACLLHRRELVGRIGPLDERFFMYCEDVDFCLRARRAGWAVRYHPGLHVVHHVAGSTRAVSRRMLVERHRSLWRYYLKHFNRHPLVDPVAWTAIWTRCGVVVAQDLIAALVRRS